MVYDPIRDIDVPSPASSHAGDQPWRHNLTPGSGAYLDPAREGDYGISPSDGRGSVYDGRPPAFHSNGAGQSPSSTLGMKRSVSGGLRGLLNDDEPSSRRSSGQSGSGISTGGGEEDHRPSISRMLNDDRPASGSMVKSTSRSSLVSSSPDMSSRHLEHLGFLTPASTSARSRSPHPIHTNSLSPAQHPSYLPHDPHSAHEYSPQPETHAGPSGRRVSGNGPRPMLPPDTIPRQEYYDSSRVTPGAQVYPLPLRSPSVSVSPRSNSQALPGYSSRPTSSKSNSQPFSYPPPVQLDSPTLLQQPLPQHHSRSPSEPRSRQTSSAPRRSRGTSISSRTPLQSPIPARTPYQPNRISQPQSVLRPILPDEIERLRSAGLGHNPLRRQRKKPAPSWSGPSPGASRNRDLPAESDSSYFPSSHQTPEPGPSRKSSQVGRREGSVPSTAVALTPGGYAMTPSEEESRGSGGTKRKIVAGVKRAAADGENGHDEQRRKVSDGHYVGNSAVASHYNSRPDVGVQHREFSPIIGLKKFNNWIKSVLIGKFTHRGSNGRGASVLDIGCGKGGDLNKWRVAGIKLYVALDIADISVDQARGRFNSQKNRPFEGHFFAHDCFSQPLSDILPAQLQVRDLYDNVTMQFCMHYAFESPNKARMMMENVSRYLRVGGIFIGTIPNAETLLENLGHVPEDAPELRFGNSCYFIEFTERHHKGMYGHAYRFFLQDAVDDVPEYIVHWENFVNLAQEYRLRLIYKKTFSEVLNEEQNSRDYAGLLKKMGVVNDAGESAMDADQWEAANLYMAFAFEKF